MKATGQDHCAGVLAEEVASHDPYMEWIARQGVPIVEDFGIDIRKVPVAPWARYGMHGAFCHLKGRDDFLSIFAFELPPGGKSAPLRHICEEVIYVISGHGSTVVTTEDGRKHSFEWGPKSLFSIPLNVRHQHFNGSARRLPATSSRSRSRSSGLKTAIMT